MAQVSATIPVYGTQGDVTVTATPQTTPDGNITVTLGSDFEAQPELSAPIASAIQHALQFLIKA